MKQITFEQLPETVSSLFQKVENIERLLLEKGEVSQEADELLTIQQAAQFLTLSVHTLYGLVSRSVLPVNKRGKRLYFSRQELIDWVKAGRRKTQSETAKEADDYLRMKRRKS